MKRNVLVAVLVILSVLVVGGCTTKTVSKDEAIIGEWEYDASKNNTTDTTSNFMFYENGNFQWLVVSSDSGETILYDGSYIAADTLSLIVGTDKPAEFEYSFDGDYLKFDGLYYKKGENLNFIPTQKINPLVGEWALDAEKSGVSGGISQFKFDSDYNVKWLLSNQGGIGTKLLEGTYTASNDKATLNFTKFDSLEDPMDVEYKVQEGYLIIGI